MKKTVVIVGGSFAGVSVVRHIDPSFQLILIEPRDYFEYTPGILHVMCGSGAECTIMKQLNSIARNVQLVKGMLIGIDYNKRNAIVCPVSTAGDCNPLLEDCIEISFDAIVFCDGRFYSHPIRTAFPWSSQRSRVLELRNYLNNLLSAESIVILGGGLVGVELAAECASRLQNSSTKPFVTLITRSRCLSGLPEAAGYIAKAWLQRAGVIVYENEDIASIRRTKESLGTGEVADMPWADCHNGGNKYITTTSGKELFATLYIDCTGRKLHSDSNKLDTHSAENEIQANDLSISILRDVAMSKYNEHRDEGHRIIWPKHEDNSLDVDDTLQVIHVLYYYLLKRLLYIRS